jgi:hypothetical protein
MVYETTTTQDRDSLIEMFIDGTAEEVYECGRLLTRPTENGVQLVAYGNEVLAENKDGNITIYTGHHGTVSKTVTRYIKRLGSLLNDTNTRKVRVAEYESPTLGIGARASDSAQYIQNYIGIWKHLSKVEQDALEEVNEALAERTAQILG